MGSERPRAETTPAVTEPAKPCGLPIATTSWPTRSRSASPSSAGGEIARVDAQHGEVGEGVGADDLELELAAVDERRAAAAFRARDDVGGGEREAVRRDHDAAAAPVEHAAAAHAARDAEVRDGGAQPLGHGRHGLRVGVERFVVRVADDEMNVSSIEAKLATAAMALSICESHAMAEVETSRDGAVLTITLNRPDVLNAFNAALHKALSAALKEARGRRRFARSSSPAPGAASASARI